MASGSASFEHCVAGIEAGRTYSFGGRLRFPTGQTPTGYALILLKWMEQEDCLGNVIDIVSSDATVQSSTAGTWVDTRGDEVVAPAGTHGAAVDVHLVKDSNSSLLDLRFDSIYLVPAAGFLFADGFEIESICRRSAEAP